MMIPDSCPVCLNAFGGQARVSQSSIGWDLITECDICGRFTLSLEAFDDYLDPATPGPTRMTKLFRARLSHRIRTSADNSPKIPANITADSIERFLKDGAPGPTPAEQANNIIRFIGDHVSNTGESLEDFPTHFYSSVGSPNPSFAANLVCELHDRGLVTGSPIIGMNGSAFINAGLTLTGWQQYEAEKRGRLSGNYGFIALKFNDDTLDSFVTIAVKPAVETVGFRLVDMRDVKEAGVIDNLMRMRIRDAAFVLADLTHANNGAYWEAGFAEGLGKPVVYLCEKSKFDQERPHFDTNHCTTILWDSSDPVSFQEDLIATLRNSLKMFPSN